MTWHLWESRGVLWGLADYRFREMVTPRLIGWLYVAAAGSVALGTVVALLMVWSMANWMGPGCWWFAPVVIAAGAAGVLAVRIACEWVLMAFTRGRRVESGNAGLVSSGLSCGTAECDRGQGRIKGMCRECGTTKPWTLRK